MKNEKQENFLAAYDKCHDPFLRYCSALAYGKMDVRDLVQDVLLSAYQHFDSIKEKEQLLHYLIRTARNISIDQWRKSQHKAKFIEQHNHRLTAYGTTPDVLTDITFLHEAIDKLPAHQGEALLLFEVLGFSMKEIAEMQDSKVGAVKTKISRGRKALQGLLQEEPIHENDSGGRKRSLLLLMATEEGEDGLFDVLREVPKESLWGDIEIMIKGFSDLPPELPESGGDDWLGELLGNINFNEVLVVSMIAVLVGFIFFGNTSSVIEKDECLKPIIHNRYYTEDNKVILK